MSNSNRDTNGGPLLSRRTALSHTLTGLGALGLVGLGSGHASESADERRVREFLKPLLLTRADVDDWLAGKEFPFCKYDPELGYLHIDRDFKEGVGGAICQYRYDRLDARRMKAHADKPCRINTYGNSFTSCEQVSDGETWQEVLAAHLCEPVRNYGIGGYSVYQAYLRMRREEQRAPARYIVLNIFDDDHYRNLHGWQRFKFGVNRKSPNPTVPHVRVNPDKKEFREVANPCPTRESIYELCDLDAVCRKFKDDVYLQNRLARAAGQQGRKRAPASDFDDRELTRHALFASMEIVKKVREFAAGQQRTVLYVLSYNPQTVRRFLKDGERFDREFVDFIQRERLPYVDLLQAHAADYAKFRGSIDEYVARYFIGHYNPLGNFFCAFAMKDKLVSMLNPKPPAYAK